MAQLIRTAYKPQKWLLKKHIDTLPTNRLISHKSYIMTNERREYFDNALVLCKSIVKDYVITKETYVKAGLDRSMRKYRAKLAIETTLQLITWRLNVKKEAHAINKLAQKIAATITSASNVSDKNLSNIDVIERELLGFFTLRIELPQKVMVRIAEQYREILELVDGLLSLSTHEHDKGAQIWVNACEMSFSLDFDDADIDKLLKHLYLGLCMTLSH